MPNFPTPRLVTAADRPAILAATEIDDKFGVLCRAAFDGVFVHDHGMIVEANDKCAEMLGCDLAELVGRSMLDFIVPEMHARILKHCADGTNSACEIIAVRANGDRFPVEISGIPVGGSSQRVVAIRDLTEREASLATVRQSEEQFRSIIENASDLIAIIERDGRIRYHSPSIERVLGITPAFVIGRPAVDIVHPDDAQRAWQFLQRQVSEPVTNGSISLRLQHRNGSWRSFEVVARNLSSGGVVTAIVTNARDITDRALLETQLAQANRLSSLGRLAATVAHEFNNVLMGMQPFAELMQRPDAAPSMITRGAWHISNSIQRGKRIVLDILRFTQPSQPQATMVDVGEWWEKFSFEAETVLGNTVRLISKVPYRDTCIVADKDQLSQVMANLVANARDAMPAGGTLTVEALQPSPDSVFVFGVVANPERFVQISVSDTGLGIAPEIMQHIFEPLFTTRKSGGTGLGLAVAHQVMTQNGGHIFAESDGRGATFHLFLPKAATACRPRTEVANRLQETEGLTVLMVEDEHPIVEGITALLDCVGMKVVAVGRGGEAAAAVEQFHPDVVLLDVGLPDMDGSEVYKIIRALNPLLPVIFASGHGDGRAFQDGLADSRTRFLQKPFELDTLLGMITELSGPDTDHD